MAVLAVCGQRVRLLRLRIAGMRRGILRPELVGVLDKQGEPGRLTFHKWRTRRFELRGGSLYYYDREDLARPKGLISLAFRGVEILSEGHRESTETHSFVICTPARNWCLRAPDAETKELWVERLRAHVGRTEAPLRHIEDMAVDVLHDGHLLDLSRLSSADQLRTSLNLTLRATSSGTISTSDAGPVGSVSSSAGASKSVYAIQSLGTPRVTILSIASPLARPAALQIQGAWQRMTTYLGSPLRGSERSDGWLQPHSDLPSLPMQSCDLVWRPVVHDSVDGNGDGTGACADGKPTRRGKFGLMGGWMLTKPQTEDGIAWRHANVQRRFCVLDSETLRCYASEDDARRAVVSAAAALCAIAPPTLATSSLPTTPLGPGTVSRLPLTPVVNGGHASAPSGNVAASPQPSSTSVLALSTIELCRVTRVRPSADPSAAPHAFELRTLAESGHELTAVFEAALGFEGTDSWLRALQKALPACAFDTAREGAISWNFFPDPMLALVEACIHHPRCTMPPADEVASSLLSVAEWRGLAGCERAAAALRAATVGSGTATIDLCQRRPHQWSDGELTLLLTALMHSARVSAVCLRGFHLANPTSQPTRALAALLGRNVCLQRLELRGCHIGEASLALWTSAIEANANLPLRSLALVGCDGLPRCCSHAGASLARVLRSLHSPLLELELDGCGITGGALRDVLDSLHRHDHRFLTLGHLRSLTLNSDTLEEKHTQAALTSLLRRASNLRQLRLLRADRAAADGVGGGGLGLAGGDGDAGFGIGGGGVIDGGGGGGWFCSAAGLAEVLEALHASAPPLECLAVDGCAVASGDDRASLAILRVATRFESLRQLSLGGTRIQTDSLCAVVAILVHNSSRPPLSLDCARNKLGPLGGRKLAAVLHGAVSLRSLEAADNDFGAGAIACLAEALRGSANLLALGLARNIRTPSRQWTSAAQRLAALQRDEDADEGAEANDAFDEDDSSAVLGCYSPGVALANSSRHHVGGLFSTSGSDDADVRRAFRALNLLLADSRCRVQSVDLSGDSTAHCVPDEFGSLLLSLSRCKTLTRADVSGHAAGGQPGALGALLHILRRSRGLRHLFIHRNALDSASLRAVLGGWRRRNLTLQRLSLFAADPRDAHSAKHALAHEAVRSPAVAAELMEEAEQLSRRNRRLADALVDSLAV